MSVSSLSGVTIPDPASYTSGSLPWGIDAPFTTYQPKSRSAPAATTAAATSPYQTQYDDLVRYDNAELLYASFLSPDQALANGNAVLEQASALLDHPVSGTLVNSLA